MFALWTLYTLCVARQPYDVQTEGSPVNRYVFTNISIDASTESHIYFRIESTVTRHGLSPL